jgi:uncharacterized protein YbjT (DUF2867 family)
MKIAGASGAVGRRLVPLLVASGYDIVAMTRYREKAQSLRALGATAVVADGLDRVAVIEGVMGSEPDISTGYGPRAPTICSRPPGPRASVG